MRAGWILVVGLGATTGAVLLYRRRGRRSRALGTTAADTRARKAYLKAKERFEDALDTATVEGQEFALGDVDELEPPDFADGADRRYLTAKTREYARTRAALEKALAAATQLHDWETETLQLRRKLNDNGAYDYVEGWEWEWEAHDYPTTSPLGIARMKMAAIPAGRRACAWDRAFVDVDQCVPRDMDIARLPPEVRDFGAWMRKRARQPVTPRDVAKAYLLTLSSIQREARDADVVRQSWPGLPVAHGTVRPEDVFGLMLQTPEGRRYLDAAAAGRYDAKDAKTLARWHSKFGLTGQLAQGLRDAPALATSKELPRVLRRGTTDEWIDFALKNVRGIGVAKAGFFSALLGRGDLPTLDAKELEFWGCSMQDWDRARRQCRGGRVLPGFVVDPGKPSQGKPALQALVKRIDSLPTKVAKPLQPFRRHLLHHALWDRIAGTHTTHQEMIDAMELAGS